MPQSRSIAHILHKMDDYGRKSMFCPKYHQFFCLLNRQILDLNTTFIFQSRVIQKLIMKHRKILTNFWNFSEIFIKKKKIRIFEVLGEFWQGFKEPRSVKIYSLGNRGVKKGLGPQGSRNKEFLVPSLNCLQVFTAGKWSSYSLRIPQ